MQNHHAIFKNDAIGLAVGVGDTPTLQKAFRPRPGDALISVLTGAFAISLGVGAAGQGAVFRKAIPVTWK